MRVTPTALPDVKLIVPKKFEDERGFFVETYNQRALSAQGLDTVFVQDNHSLSRRVGTVRGLHFQIAPFAQDKLIQVTRAASSTWRSISGPVRPASAGMSRLR